jgi:hypothetical protein
MLGVAMMIVVRPSVVAPSPLVNIAATHSVVLDTFVKRCEGEVGPLKYSNDPVYNLFKRLSDLQRGVKAIIFFSSDNMNGLYKLECLALANIFSLGPVL